MQTCTVDANGNVEVTLSHCSDYVLTVEDLPQALLAAADVSQNNTSVSQNTTDSSINNIATSPLAADNSVLVATGDKAPVMSLVLICLISAAVVIASGVVLKMKRKKDLQ